jgi:hypothetical protein
MAPQVGFEPTTYRLTAGCSTIELLRNKSSLAATYSPRGYPQVPSALEGLTSVFEMGTGVAPPPLPPENWRSDVRSQKSDVVQGRSDLRLLEQALLAHRTLKTEQWSIH